MDYIKHPYNKLTPIPFYKIKIIDNFWETRQKLNREVSIPLQLEKLEEDHHIDNFRVAAGFSKGTHLGEFYFDSDLYKWLEAACYILHNYEDISLEKNVNEIISLISNSQLNDGYLNTFYSTKFLDKRLTNFLFMHELYCAGHLIEAAIAHYKATNTRELLNVAEKFADLIIRVYRKKKIREVPGHEEIELALLGLFRITKKMEYLSLSKDFINNRGKMPRLKTYIIQKYLNYNQTIRKAKKYNEDFKKRNLNMVYNKRGEKDEIEAFYADLTLKERVKFIISIISGKCYQLNVPVREIVEPVGHAVRAMYLYCGMADLYSETGDKALLKALKRIWLKVLKAKMYITGGIGSIKGIEGFEKDFKLRNDRSYSETCAAIGSLMWNWRLLQISGNCKYADLLEKILYNAMLAGYSIDGRRYFYTNPLISYGEEERKEWFLCSCCPPNVARTIASLGKYIYSTSDQGVWVHQYIGSNVNLEIVNNNIKLIQESEFPWKFKVKIRLSLNRNLNFSIFLRVPKWSLRTNLAINGVKYKNSLNSGRYVKVFRNWMDQDQIDLEFINQPLLLESDHRVKDSKTKGALSYGPLIYCLEQKDNEEFDIFKAIIPKDQKFQVIYNSKLFNGMNTIEGKVISGDKFKAIPYFAWNNRGADKMQVWHKIC